MLFNSYEFIFLCLPNDTHLSAQGYPATGAVPTKISVFKGNWNVLRVLFNACFGIYNPRLTRHPGKEGR